jgi:hypothetical protein
MRSRFGAASLERSRFQHAAGSPTSPKRDEIHDGEQSSTRRPAQPYRQLTPANELVREPNGQQALLSFPRNTGAAGAGQRKGAYSRTRRLLPLAEQARDRSVRSLAEGTTSKSAKRSTV